MAAVLVYIDLDGIRPHAASLHALAAGRLVASSWGATLYAALILHDSSQTLDPGTTGRVSTSTPVPGLDALETKLSRLGADKIIVAMTDVELAPLWATLGSAWSGVLDHLRPRLVLFGADAPATAELGPRTGARIGARLLPRARAVGIDDVELRDRDGGYVRASESGAAVAFIGTANPELRCDEDVDLVVLTLPGEDPHIELGARSPVQVLHTTGVVIALGDDALDPGIVANARRLAGLLDAQLIGGPAAARIGAIEPAAAFERGTPFAPEVCIILGTVPFDLAGATSIIRIGAPSSAKNVDGALPGPLAEGLADLVRALETTA